MAEDGIRVDVEWAGALRFVAQGVQSQQTFVMEAGPSTGEPRQGVSPTEALVASVAGCSGMDIMSILTKMRQDVTGFTTHVVGYRREEHPRGMVKVEVEYVLRGKNLSEAAVARAVELSRTKYCGVMASLKAEIITTFRIQEQEGA
ncbi:MAG: OsmC family protein [Anaerolineae bacterium]|jgi:putative redox protein|nr:OsmC family protein [Chloroflexota bacterium]